MRVLLNVTKFPVDRSTPVLIAKIRRPDVNLKRSNQ